MEQLIYEITGKKYLLFQVPFSDVGKANQFQETVKKFDGIVQGVCDLKRGWFSGSFTLKALIPEERAIEFSNFDHR